MAHKDHEFDPITAEELEKTAQQKKLSRKIRHEFMRIQKGEADDDIKADLEEQENTRKEQEQADVVREKRESSFFQQFISGNILVKKGVVKYYRHFTFIAVMFLLSIMVVFFTFHLDVTQIATEKRVQLLRERSIRLQEHRYSLTRQSAITKELELRGIELYDPSKPNAIIED